MSVKELIDQIGGRERLELLSEYRPNRVEGLITFREIKLMSRALLAVLDAKPVAFTDDEELRNVKNGTCGEMFNGDYIDKFDGQWLCVYLTPPADSVPDGWKLVPVIPTWGMLSSDGCSKHHNGQECSHHENRKRIWSAMLAAAPAPGEKS